MPVLKASAGNADVTPGTQASRLRVILGPKLHPDHINSNAEKCLSPARRPRSQPLVPILQRPFHLHHVPFAFISMFFTQLDRQRFQQAEGDIHGLEVFRLDIRNITA